MPTEATPYQLADKTIELLNRKAIKRFEEAKSKAALLKFDELNVITICKDLYAKLADDNQSAFLELAQEQYAAAEPHGFKKPDMGWLLELLLMYDPVTLYVYQNEVERKRDRTAEAINASTSRAAKAVEFRRGLSYWAQMTAHYADEVNDKATLKAFEDAGVKKVRWNTLLDGHECETCRERDGKVYPIEKVPPKPHWRCRCWLTAVVEEK